MTESIKKRIDWIDFAKGIAILCVIIGHNGGNVIRGAIYSFHMPLFFLLSCITFRFSKNNSEFINNTRRAFKHLITPAVLLYLLGLIISLLQGGLSTQPTYFIQNELLKILFCSGIGFEFLGRFIPAIGLPWFLVSLFMGRSIWDFIDLHTAKKTTKIIICAVLTIIGVVIGQIQWLPLSFDITLSLMPFFYIGKEFNIFSVEKNPVKKLVISFLVWAASMVASFVLVHDYLELAYRRYTLFPFCYFIAVVGIIMIAEISVIICKNPKISAPIRYLGKNSLYMLFVHSIDYSILRPLWDLSENIYVTGLIRIIVDSIVFALLMVVITFISKTKKRRTN